MLQEVGAENEKKRLTADKIVTQAESQLQVGKQFPNIHTPVNQLLAEQSKNKIG